MSLALALLATLPAQGLARGAAGHLDRSFGGDGTVSTKFPMRRSWANSVAIDSRSRIVAAGTAGGRAFALARYKPNGRLDRSFGHDGRVTKGMGLPFQTIYAVVIDSRGRIVAAGTAGYSGQHEFALARYKPNGHLDRSFSGDGRVTTNFPGGDTSASGVAIDSRDRMVAAGYTGDYPDWDFAMARYKRDGARDRSFGTGGKVVTESAVATSVAIASHDRIVVAGSGGGGFDSDFVLARYQRDGSLDAAFGAGGEATTDFGGSDGVSSIAIGSHGRIVAAGSTSPTGGGSSEFALARYTRDGTLDDSFGAGGKVATGFPRRYDGASSVAIDSRGRVVAVGSTAERLVYHGSTSSRFAVARFKPNGHLDRSFSGNGKVSKPRGAAHAGMIDSRNRIVAAGVKAHRFALTRYLGG
jgi:uncharacterized delta-60 repeat protein